MTVLKCFVLACICTALVLFGVVCQILGNLLVLIGDVAIHCGDVIERWSSR